MYSQCESASTVYVPKKVHWNFILFYFNLVSFKISDQFNNYFICNKMTLG